MQGQRAAEKFANQHGYERERACPSYRDGPLEAEAASFDDVSCSYTTVPGPPVANPGRSLPDLESDVRPIRATHAEYRGRPITPNVRFGSPRPRSEQVCGYAERRGADRCAWGEPASVRCREALRVSDDDEVAFVDTGRGIVVVPADQAWYWTPEWQVGEPEAGFTDKRGRAV